MAVLHEDNILTFGQEGFLKDVRFFYKIESFLVGYVTFNQYVFNDINDSNYCYC